MISIFTWYFLSFKGRISRREFFLGYLGLLVLCGLLSQSLLSATFRNPTGRIWSAHELGVALSTPFIISVAMLLWPFFAISAKRLHDIGVSGWWLTATVAMPFVSKFANINFSTLLLVSVTILSGISGRPHSNRFGDQPPVQSKST
jgi:uncharacterized membrane protein YhaH (DUF805 family)